MICTACLKTITTWMELHGLPYCRPCFPIAKVNQQLEDAGFMLVKRVIRRAG